MGEYRHATDLTRWQQSCAADLSTSAVERQEVTGVVIEAVPFFVFRYFLFMDKNHCADAPQTVGIRLPVNLDDMHLHQSRRLANCAASPM